MGWRNWAWEEELARRLAGCASESSVKVDNEDMVDLQGQEAEFLIRCLIPHELLCLSLALSTLRTPGQPRRASPVDRADAERLPNLV